VEFGEEFGKESGVLVANGKDSHSPVVLRGADSLPSDLALTAIASFLASPKKSAPTFVNGFNHACWKDSGSHGMSKHGSEDRVDKKQATANGKGAPTLARKPQITLSHDRVEIGNAQLVSREG
jgi:hypothetical protein